MDGNTGIIAYAGSNHYSIHYVFTTATFRVDSLVGGNSYNSHVYRQYSKASIWSRFVGGVPGNSIHKGVVYPLPGYFRFCMRNDYAGENYDLKSLTLMGTSPGILEYTFAHCYRLEHIDYTSFDFSTTVSMQAMFTRNTAHGPTVFQQTLNIDTSNVKDMRNVFKHTSYSKDIAHWDFSSVTSMESMFLGTSNWNHPVNWSVPEVTSLGNMFAGSRFNSPATFRGSKISTLQGMFAGKEWGNAEYASTFNQPITITGASNIWNMMYMFYGNTAFDNRIYISCSGSHFRDMFTDATGMSSCSKYHMNQLFSCSTGASGQPSFFDESWHDDSWDTASCP